MYVLSYRPLISVVRLTKLYHLLTCMQVSASCIRSLEGRANLDNGTG